MSLLEIKSEAQRAKEKLETIKEVFDVFDKSLPGAPELITADKLRSVLTVYNSSLTSETLSEQTVKDIVASLDGNNNGGIPFKGGFVKLGLLNDEEDDTEPTEFKDEDLTNSDTLKVVFAEFDKDKDGVISVDDFKALVLSVGGQKVTDEQAYAMVCLADPSKLRADQSPGVTFQAFQRMMADKAL